MKRRRRRKVNQEKNEAKLFHAKINNSFYSEGNDTGSMYYI